MLSTSENQALFILVLVYNCLRGLISEMPFANLVLNILSCQFPSEGAVQIKYKMLVESSDKMHY